MQTASKRSAWEFGAAKLQQRSAACVNAFMIVPDFHVLKWLLGSQSFLSNMSHRFFKALLAWSNFEYPKCSLLLRNHHHHQQHLLHLLHHHHQAAAILQPLCFEEGFWSRGNGRYVSRGSRFVFQLRRPRFVTCLRQSVKFTAVTSRKRTL